jgi:hypothetical protein
MVSVVSGPGRSCLQSRWCVRDGALEVQQRGPFSRCSTKPKLASPRQGHWLDHAGKGNNHSVGTGDGLAVNLSAQAVSNHEEVAVVKDELVRLG